MGIKMNSGFTLIEVMLFLAVTGLLVAAILMGSGVTIGQQRYRDSVNSLKSYIQDQFANTSNVINDRDQNWTCDSSGNVTQVTSSGQPRGTSDCVILGRYVTVGDNGIRLTSSNVVGYRTPGAAVAASDIAELASNYHLAVSPINQDAQDVNWGAQIVKPKTNTPMPFSLLILRSPLSGTLLTFSADGVATDLNKIVTVANNNQRRDLCVNADAGSFVGKRLEVRLDALAANQGAVSIPAESDSICG